MSQTSMREEQAVQARLCAESLSATSSVLPQFPNKTPQHCSRCASAGFGVIVSSRACSEGRGGEEASPWGQGWNRRGKTEREASTEAWGQLIPSHWGFSPSSILLVQLISCRGSVPLPHPLPPPCRKKAVPVHFTN